MNLTPTILLALVALAAARPSALDVPPDKNVQVVPDTPLKAPTDRLATPKGPGALNDAPTNRLAIPPKGPGALQPKLGDAPTNRFGGVVAGALNDGGAASRSNNVPQVGQSRVTDSSQVKSLQRIDSVEVGGLQKPKAKEVSVLKRRKRRAMEAAAKRFHAHNRRRRVFPKRDVPSDTDILNFALTLEHLVSAFYKSGLEKYSVRQFRGAGYEAWTRRRYEQLAKNTRTHVQFLESALGDKAVKACRYDLKDKSLGDWVAKSFVIENVAASAWNGFVGILQDRSYQTVAASIMGVKARHAAWINSVVRKSNAWNTAFETPLDMNQVYTIILPYIIPNSCPSTNAPLRATPFSALHVPPCRPGSVITLEYERERDAKKAQVQLYAAFVSGTGTVFVSMREEGKVEVPTGLVGVVFVFVTRDGGKVGTEGIVAGPGVVWFGFRA